MTTQPKHIINKLFVEVDCNSMEDALRLKQNLGQFITEKLSTHLSKAFDELGPSDEFYTIDKVAVAFEKDFLKESNLSEITSGCMGQVYFTFAPSETAFFLGLLPPK